MASNEYPAFDQSDKVFRSGEYDIGWIYGVHDDEEKVVALFKDEDKSEKEEYMIDGVFKDGQRYSVNSFIVRLEDIEKNSLNLREGDIVLSNIHGLGKVMYIEDEEPKISVNFKKYEDGSKYNHGQFNSFSYLSNGLSSDNVNSFISLYHRKLSMSEKMILDVKLMAKISFGNVILENVDKFIMEKLIDKKFVRFYKKNNEIIHALVGFTIVYYINEYFYDNKTALLISDSIELAILARSGLKISDFISKIIKEYA